VLTALLGLALQAPKIDVVYVVGGRLAYNGRLYRDTANVREPSLSPDRKRAVYWQSGNVSPVFEIDLATGKRRRLAGDNARSPFYSPDGNTVYFTQSLPWEVYAVPAAGGKAKRILAATPEGDYFHPMWTPGQPTFVVQNMTSLLRVRFNGAVAEKIPLSRIIGKFGTSSGDVFAERPGEPTTIVFSTDVPYTGNLFQDSAGLMTTLYVRDLKTGKLRQLTPAKMWAQSPRWSRDGQWVVFSGFRTKTDSAIYAIRPDGTGLRRLYAKGEEPGT